MTAAQGKSRRGERSETLVDTIYRDTRQRLNQGEWRPGDRLLDYEIGERFGCTRMPVRQALLRLVNEGLLNGTTRGFQVPVMTDAMVRDVFELRRILEPAAAALVVATADHKQLHAALSKAIDLAKVAMTHNDPALMFSANASFRHAWLQCVRNERLVSMIAMSADHANQVRFSNTQDTANFARTVAALEQLSEALTSGDAERARGVMHTFLLAAEAAYFERRLKI
ncbi:MAG: GntR family transcriptional regulator [Paraburkholderia sp.]|jgi:DNA-binding GntR family transcriptional regulator|nr:GntR family transcriptional regulator [Paraburkholderia sp.]